MVCTPGSRPLLKLAPEIQEPLGATDLQIVPAAASRETRADGITYNHGVVDGRSSAAPGSFSFTYKKADRQLSIQRLQPRQPAAPPTGPSRD